MMNATLSSAVPVLNALIKTCLDGTKGFEQAAEKVAVPEFKTLFIELASQRRQFGGELTTLVADLGGKPETTGSIEGMMHIAWMRLRALITIDGARDILVECRRGEDSAVAEYGYALDRDDLPTQIYNVIRRQYIAVKATHRRMCDLLERLST